MPAKKKTTCQAPAAQKAFELLKCFAESQSEITLSDLARQLGFSKGTTHGMIQALLQAGALEQGPNRKGFFLRKSSQRPGAPQSGCASPWTAVRRMNPEGPPGA